MLLKPFFAPLSWWSWRWYRTEVEGAHWVMATLADQTPDTGISASSHEWERSLSYQAQIKLTVKIEISERRYLIGFVDLLGDTSLTVKTTNSGYKIITCSHERKLVAAATCCIICERRLVFHAALACAFLSSLALLKYTIRDSCLNLAWQSNT